MGDSIKILSDVRLPTFPKLVERLQSLYDKGANFADFADVVSTDSALSMQIIKAANSKHFITDNDVSDLKEAIERLGTGRLMEIVYALRFSHISPSSNISIEEYWSQTLYTAVMARKMAEHLELEKPSRMFTLGLFSNIGNLLTLVLDDEEKNQVMRISKHIKVARHSTDDFLGYSMEIALCDICLLYWGFPKNIRYPISFQLEPQNAPTGFRLEAYVLNAAVYMRLQKYKSQVEIPEEDQETFARSFKKLVMDREIAHSFSASAENEVKAMLSFISV